jgi:hypothetical protein
MFCHQLVPIRVIVIIIATFMYTRTVTWTLYTNPRVAPRLI